MPEDIIQKIISATKMNEQDVEFLVKEKQRELSDLVSREGASYIVAKELGVDVMNKPKQTIDIRGLVPGIRNLTLAARVSRKFDPRSFTRDGKESKVANIILADGSGTTRMSFWDNQTELLEKINVGDAVEIYGAYTKEDNRGDVEVRIGRSGSVKLMQETKLPELEKLQRAAEKGGRVGISELREGDNAEIRASIVQLFETEQFYEICPQCGTRLKSEKVKIKPGVEGTEWKCPTHGTTEPQMTIVLSGVIDDGTGNIRVVFFRDLAAKVLGMEMDEIISKRGHVFDNVDIVGKEFVIKGRARRNKMFDRLEFIAGDVDEINVRKEIELLLNAFASNNNGSSDN